MGVMNEISDFVSDHPVITVIGILALTEMVVRTAEYVSPNAPEIRHEQVIGERAEETYIEVGGQKYYLKIDGVPVEDNYR